MTSRRRLWLLAILLAGCAADAPSQADKGYSVTGKDPFRFEVDAHKLREWGGPNSPELETFSVTGRCRS